MSLLPLPPLPKSLAALLAGCRRFTDLHRDVQKPALLSGLSRAYKPRADEPKPDPAWKTIDGATWIGQVHDAFSPSKVTGALWMRMGVSS